MRFQVRFGLPLLLFCVATFIAIELQSSAAQQRRRPLAFTHVNIVDSTQPGVRRDQVLVVNETKISAVGPFASISIPADAEVIDATGKFIIPGLWDLHVHTRYDGIDHLRLSVAHGITGVRDMGGDWAHLDRMRAWRRQIEEGRLVGPHIVPVGPLLDGPGSPWSHAQIVNGPDEGRAIVRRLKTANVRFAKVYTLLSRESFHAIADESSKQGLTVSGHLPRSVGAGEASNAGQRTIEHAYELFLSTSSREEEYRTRSQPVTQAESLASFDPAKAGRLFEQLKRNSTAIVPTLALAAIRARIAAGELGAAASQLSLVPAAYVEAWRKEPAGSRDAASAVMTQSKEVVRRAYQAGVEVLPGTDVVKAFFIPGHSLHEELSLLVDAGMSPAAVLEAATRRAAAMAGEVGRGTVEPGKVADIVLLSANPLDRIENTRKIAGVVAAGRYFDQPMIEEMLNEIRRDASQWKGTPTGR